jgi:hypothetical protein
MHRSQRANNLRFWYGIELIDYDRMLRKQKGVCAICKKPCARGRLSVDHNHKTLVIRGLLCNSCNTKLGWFERNRKRIFKHLGEKDA